MGYYLPPYVPVYSLVYLSPDLPAYLFKDIPAYLTIYDLRTYLTIYDLPAYLNIYNLRRYSLLNLPSLRKRKI